MTSRFARPWRIAEHQESFEVRTADKRFSEIALGWARLR
jgi:hypothetical protein